MQSSLDVKLMGDEVHQKYVYLFLLYFIKVVLKNKYCADSVECFVQKEEIVSPTFGETSTVYSWTLATGKTLRYIAIKNSSIYYTLFVDGVPILKVMCPYTAEEIQKGNIRTISLVLEVSIKWGDLIIKDEDSTYIEDIVCAMNLL